MSNPSGSIRQGFRTAGAWLAAGVLALWIGLCGLPTIADAQSVGGSPPYGTQVGSGILSPAAPKLAFANGPFVVPNVSEQESLLGLVGAGTNTPTCASTPALPGGALTANACDFYVVTVN